MTLKTSLKVIQTDTIWKLGCGFLFAFHSNYGRVFRPNRLWDIHRQSIAWPWKLGLGFWVCSRSLKLSSFWVRGHSRSFKMVLFESLGAASYSPSIVTIALSCISFEIKRDIGRKSWFFHTPCIHPPPLVGSPSKYLHPVWCGKSIMVGLLDGEKTLRICITV